MSLFVVTEKASGSEVTRYVAIAATESVGYSFADFDHAETPEAPEQPVVVDPALWRIDVGSFFDRFGDAKLAILASENTIVKAMITDASVRKYISLIERKDELTQMLGLLQSLVPGIGIDVTAILETEPTDAERWNG